MVSFRVLIIGICISLLMLLACSVDAQTIHYFTGDSVLCYTAICSHPKTFRDTIAPPFDGCISVDQAAPGWGSLVLVIGQRVVLDSCIFTDGDGIGTEVCWSSTDTVHIFYFGPDSTALGVWYFATTGNSLLSDTVAYLCPPLTSIARPQLTQIPSSGYTDMLGRYWPEQPIGISFSWALMQKVLRIR